MKLTSKILSTILMTGAILFVLPGTYSIFSWLDSGVTSGYFYLIFPYNVVILVMSFLSIFSFKKNLSQDKLRSLFISNIIASVALVIWLFFYLS
jgi:hypothetical protein